MKIIIFFLFCSGLMAATALGQLPAKKSALPLVMADSARFPVAKYGPFDSSSKVFATTLKNVLNLELKVTDARGNAYSVYGYRLGWRRKEQSDDWRTGKRKTIFSFNAVEVNGSPKIPADWQKEMGENLQTGEVVYFENILAQDKKTGRVYKVHGLKITLL